MAKLKTVYMPEYYEKFQCLGSACRDTCCTGDWRITISKKDYMKIRALRNGKETEEMLKTAFKRCRENVTDEVYAVLTADSRSRCALLSEDGLCNLQLACGFGVLPQICKDFPRHNYNYTNCVEKSCSPGCERVVQMLMDLPDGLQFHKVLREETNIIGNHYTDARLMESRPLFRYYHELQAFCIHLMQNRKHSLTDRMILLGIALKDLAAFEEKGELDKTPAWIEKMILLTEETDLSASLAKLSAKPELSAISNFNTGRLLEHDKGLSSIWKEINRNYGATEKDGVWSLDMERYHAAKHHLKELLNDNDALFENIMVNMMFSTHTPVNGKTVWEDYFHICAVFSTIQFIVAGYMADKEEKAELVHAITMCCRSVLHNKLLGDVFCQIFEETGSTSLAHMAILIKG